MNHDQLFKELLQEFLPDFMRLFFPDIAARLDFTRVEFPKQETFTDFPEGASRNSDVLALIYSLEGEPETLYIHVEVESRRRGEFPYRFWEYYSLLRLRRKQMIIPIVIYLSPGTGGIVMETYEDTVFGQTYLTFQYHAVGLPDLPSDDYREREEPLATALSALMRPSAVGALERKWQAMMRIARNQRLNEAQKVLLSSVVESYIELPEVDASEFERLKAEAEEIKMFVSIYEQQGIEKGIVREKRDIVLRLGRKRLGEPDVALTERIAKADAVALDTLIERLLDAESWEELREALAAPSLARD